MKVCYVYCMHMNLTLYWACADNRDDLDYVAFDFHAYCKNSQFENVNLLLDKVERRLSTIGYVCVRVLACVVV